MDDAGRIRIGGRDVVNLRKCYLGTTAAISKCYDAKGGFGS